jgi:DNA-binding PadR family transcriptional regulator
MPRSSRTPYAVLGALSHGPKSGYDISRLFEKNTMFFWNESYGQIYPTLKKLKAKGLVTMKRDARDVGPDRKVYSLTEEGQKELDRWLRQPASPHSVRDEYLLKLFFGSTEQPTITLANLEKLTAELEDTIDGLGAERDLFLENEDGEDEEELLFRELALEWSEQYHQAKLEWAKSAMEKVERLRSERERGQQRSAG